MADISTLIFEELKREIATLDIKPGQRVDETEICKRYSVTRPSVRAAFQRLSDVGLLEVVPYKGARATLIVLSEIHQIIHARTAVESWIIRDFIASGPSPFEIEDMEHNVRLQKLHIATHTEINEKEFYKLDSDLHQYWFDKMKCLNIWESFQNNITYERFKMLDFVGTQGYVNIVKDHEALVNAIKQGDADAVVPVLSKHLNAGLARMGNLIMDDYREYFILDEDNNSYWVDYNQKLQNKCF